MPIEIRELIIKAVVDPKVDVGSESSQATEKSEDKIIEESVEQTLNILEKRKER